MAGTNTNPSPGRRPGRPKRRPQAGEPVPEAACREYEARLDPASLRLVQKALKVLERRAFYRGVQLTSPRAVRDLLALRFAGLEREEFRAIWLDAQNRIIADELLFAGTLTQTCVYPREVVKAGLALNAGAVIFAHNHPSGDSTPSRADELLTCNLKSALAMVDIRCLDHFVVGDEAPLSLAERGLL